MQLSIINKRSAVAIAIFFAVIICDQIIKFSVKLNMYMGPYGQIDVTDWFKICFVENRGMAFGMDFIGTFFLAIFRVVAVGFFIYILANLVRRKAELGMIACTSCIVAGAAGNIIDNCLYGLIFTESGFYPGEIASLVPFGQGYGEFLAGRVVDMFYFPLFTWPEWMPLVGGDVFFGAIFNFADASICCGGAALLLFYRNCLSLDQLIGKAEKNGND